MESRNRTEDYVWDEAKYMGPGYLNHLVTILNKYNRPIILVEESAMHWMGLRVMSEYNIDLLIRNSQFEAVKEEINAHELFEAIEQDLGRRLSDTYTLQVPRFFDKTSDPKFNARYINLWSEDVYMLQISDAQLTPVGDIRAVNPVLLDERFATIPRTLELTAAARAEMNATVVPRFRFTTMDIPTFTPSIPALCDALLRQFLHQTRNAKDYPGKYAGARPDTHLYNFIRYLELENPVQRAIILPLLAEPGRTEMESMIGRYKRKPACLPHLLVQSEKART